MNWIHSTAFNNSCFITIRKWSANQQPVFWIRIIWPDPDQNYNKKKHRYEFYTFRKKIGICSILGRIRIRIPDPYPDPHQNEVDPKHCQQQTRLVWRQMILNFNQPFGGRHIFFSDHLDFLVYIVLWIANILYFLVVSNILLLFEYINSLIY